METLQATFAGLTEASILAIDFVALLVVVYGTFEAFIRAGQAAFFQSRPLFRPIWLRYARWLVAGLTFQLAADIIESALAPSWDDIGRLAAIAVIRTFLNYFLGRDLAEVTEEEREAVEPGSTASRRGSAA